MAFIVVALLTVLGAVGCRAKAPTESGAGSTVASRGGSITTSMRGEPGSFNRLTASDSGTVLVSALTQAKLVRVNQVSQDVEPWLAESWTSSEDGRRFTMKLRDAAFSDGTPFTAADVVFTFAALYDEKANNPLADSLKVAGKPLTVAAVDRHTVVVTFPVAFAPGVRILDNLPILPRHKLEAALKGGTFKRAWGLSASASDIVGLGPFVLVQYVPGQRLVFARNPHYWRKAPDGTALPYLDQITAEIIPDEAAELLRLESGQLDMVFASIAPEAYAPIKRAADAGRLKLIDLGVAYEADGFWINLKPHAFDGDPRAAWLQRDELRRAISMAVDRKKFSDTVFLGAGVAVYGPHTPANKVWYWADEPKTPYDPAGARALLASIGLIDRNGDRMLEDARNQPARFSILTQTGRPRLERGAAVIRDDLKNIGIAVDVVTLDANAVIASIGKGKYDAIFFNPTWTDTDPAVTPDFWFSSGSFHVWNTEQPTPATEWERQIDVLMARQTASSDMAERKKLFDDVQRIFAEHLPMVYFVAPKVILAVSSRMTNLTPAVIRPNILWSADTVAVIH